MPDDKPTLTEIVTTFGVRLERYDPQVENWEIYVERLEQAFIVNEISDDKKVSVLLSMLDAKTYRLLRDLLQPGKPATTAYKTIVDTLAKQLCPKPIEIAQRFKFHRRDQLSSENVNEFVAELKRLAADCNFKTNLAEALRDRFVCGLRNEQIQRRLLSEEGLTLEKAVELATAIEAAAKGAADIKGTTSSTVFKLGKKVGSQSTKSKVKCYCCGISGHYRRECPHKEKRCKLCNKVGHLQAVCRSMKAKKVKGSHFIDTGDETVEEVVPFNSLGNASDDEAFTLTCVLDGKQVTMEVDTGSKETVISKSRFEELFGKRKLAPSNLSLRTYFGNVVKVVGKFDVTAVINGRSKTVTMHVVPGSTEVPLIGRRWCREFGIECQLNSLKTVDETEYGRALECLKCDFASVFQPGIGELRGLRANLALKPGANPVHKKSRPVPFAIRSRVEEELERLVENNIIYPVASSDWATPVVPVVKPTGAVRICGDFKVTLNPWLVNDEHPLPRIEEIFANLGGGERFTKLDISQAYLHMVVREEDQHLVTLNTHRGLYRYRRMCYGLKVAPSIWQRAMETVLQNVPSVQVYLDDILISGQTAEAHIKTLRVVFQRFLDYDLRVNLDKCQFFLSSVEYCGHIIDAKGLHKSPKKIEAVTSAPKPKNVSELRSFLGLVNYYGKFLTNLATKLRPLHELLKKQAKWSWSPACDKAFKLAKDEVASDLVLIHFNPELPVIVSCDASQVGIGAVLSHRLDSKTEKPIAFASRTLTSAEQNYSQIEKEALSIVWGVKKFYQYVYGRKFILQTDHKPLLSIFAPKKEISVHAASRMLRYALFLQGFDYDIEYRKSEKHANCDALSRLPLVDNIENDFEPDIEMLYQMQLSALPLSVANIVQETSTDEECQQILKELQDMKHQQHDSNFTLQGGCLFRGPRLVIPKVCRDSVLKQLHQTHFGISKMKTLARSTVWWKNIDKDIEKVAQSCHVCLSVAKNPTKVEVHPWERPNECWERLHMDYAGPLFNYMFLVVVDAYSKWPEVFVHKNSTTKTVVECLSFLFSRYGLPYVLVSDNGTQFTSSEFATFAKENHFQHITTAPYTPYSNGQAEKFVQTLKYGIKAGVEDGLSIQNAVNNLLLYYRRTPHSFTGKSPAVLFLGREIRAPLDALKPRSVAKPATTQPSKTFNVGEQVLIRVYTEKQRWVVATVTAPLGNVVYMVSCNGKTFKRHVNQMRPLYGNTIEASIDDWIWSTPKSASSENKVSQPAESKERRYPTRTRKAPDRLTY